MDPVAFEIFGIGIRWYGILMATGMVLGVFLMLRFAKGAGYTEDNIIDLALVVLPLAIIGARAYYVIFNWSYYAGDFMKMINVRGGGMAIHGGVIGGLLGGFIYCKIKKLNFFELADFAAPGLILGQAIGRWGNFINQEAHGGPTDMPWGIVVDGVRVHPTFLYESVWNLMVFGLLLYLMKRRKSNGEIFGFYMIFYSIGRFFIEGLRTDSLMLGPLRMAQVISILSIVGGAAFVYYRRKFAEKR